jgi:DNA-binding response OmpR family regulator
MRASESATPSALARSAKAPSLAQFHLEPGREMGRMDMDRSLLEKRTYTVGTTPTEVSFGPFRLLPTQFLLLESGKPAPLGSRALEILIVLLERPDQLVSKQELMATRLAQHFCRSRKSYRPYVCTASNAARRTRREPVHY